MSCIRCKSPFHEVWDCPKKPAEKPPEAIHPIEAMVAQGIIEAGNAVLGMVRKRTDDRHKPGYQAAKQREYRARKKQNDKP